MDNIAGYGNLSPAVQPSTDLEERKQFRALAKEEEGIRRELSDVRRSIANAKKSVTLIDRFIARINNIGKKLFGTETTLYAPYFLCAIGAANQIDYLSKAKEGKSKEKELQGKLTDVGNKLESLTSSFHPQKFPAEFSETGSEAGIKEKSNSVIQGMITALAPEIPSRATDKEQFPL